MKTDLYIEYLKEYYQEHGTINDITSEEVVTYKNKKLNVGSFLSTMRLNHQKYLESSGKEMGTSLMLTRYNKLSMMGFNWEKVYKKDATLALEEKGIRYLRKHYKEHGTINDITGSTVVVFEGEELQIGKYIANIRNLHSAYIRGRSDKTCRSQIAKMRYSILTDLGIDWEPSKNTPAKPVRKTKEKKKQEYSPDEDPYIRYLKLHKQIYGTINDIKSRDTVVFEGQTLKFGRFIHRMINMYNNPEENRPITDITKKRYEVLTSLGLIWNKEERIAATKEKKNKEVTKKSTGTDSKSKKALKIKKLKSEYLEELASIKDSYTLKELFADFNISFIELINLLNRDSLKTAQNIGIFYYDETMTLKKFCLKNNYNYELIRKAFRLKKEKLCDENLSSLMTRVIIERQLDEDHIATWIYSKYGNPELLKNFLETLNFNGNNILKAISREGIPLELALEKELYKKELSPEKKYLAYLSHEYIKYYKKIEGNPEYSKKFVQIKLDEYNKFLTEEYELTEEENSIIKVLFEKYLYAIKQYRLFDVGFEKDENKRLEKIKQYKFTESEIEEAYFYPLQFDQNILIGSQTKLYKHRKRLKELIIVWDELTEEEKINMTRKHSLKREEVDYIKTIKESLNETKAKVFQKK